MSASQTALGLVELCSVARGVLTCDAMVKKAAIRLVQAASTHPGKYGILFRGGVDEVHESLTIGRATAAEALVDWLFLPNPDAGLLAMLNDDLRPKREAIAIIETYSMASTIRAADAALKAADVRPLHIRLARDLGGKGFFVVTGLLHDLQEAAAAARRAATDPMLAGCEIIANPHPDLLDALT